MGHKNNNIYSETIETLKGMQAFGCSKHQDKKDNATQDKIYSFRTFETYKDKCMDFIDMARRNHKCKTLAEAKQYVPEFLQSKIDKGYSAWTTKLYASALGKLYQVPANSFIKLPERKRADIIRSRKEVVRDRHFSVEKNKTLVEFCQSTGLRRKELESIRGKDCYEIDGKWYIYVKSGKGGKSRELECLDLSKSCIEKIMLTKQDDRVWGGKIHSACDIHKYRASFANAWYRKLERPIDSIPRGERYYCRGDMKGRVFDKRAMEQVSFFLGHSRICVLAYSYLR